MLCTCTGKLCRCRHFFNLTDLTWIEKKKKKLKKHLKNEGLSSLSWDTQLAEETTSLKKVFSPKEIVSNIIIGECSRVVSRSQHTEVIEVEQTFFTKTQKGIRHRQLKKKFEQQEENPQKLIGKQSEKKKKKIQGGRVTWKYRKWKIKGEKYRKFYKYIENIKKSCEASKRQSDSNRLKQRRFCKVRQQFHFHTDE